MEELQMFYDDKQHLLFDLHVNFYFQSSVHGLSGVLVMTPVYGIQDITSNKYDNYIIYVSNR